MPLLHRCLVSPDRRHAAHTPTFTLAWHRTAHHLLRTLLAPSPPTCLCRARTHAHAGTHALIVTLKASLAAHTAVFSTAAGWTKERAAHLGATHRAHLRAHRAPRHHAYRCSPHLPLHLPPILRMLPAPRTTSPG